MGNDEMNDALKALDELYRFFDVLDEQQRNERDNCIATIRAALAKVVEALAEYDDYKEKYGITQYNQHEILERIIKILRR